MIKIDIMVFSISLFIGFFCVYITSPKPNIVFKYPTVKTANDITYIDENNTCYKYIPKQVNCKKNNI
jgi:hypothetical protein